MRDKCKISMEELKELIEDDLSISEIARQQGVHRITIYNWLKRFGLKLQRIIEE